MKHHDSNVELDHRSKFDITVTFITLEEIFGCIQYIAVKPKQNTSHVLNTIKYFNKKNIYTLSVTSLSVCSLPTSSTWESLSNYITGSHSQEIMCDIDTIISKYLFIEYIEKACGMWQDVIV